MFDRLEKLITPDNPVGAAILVLAVSTVFRLAICGLVEPSVDEAYYWDWSRHLAWGYFDHPPLCALLIRLGTNVFGNNAFGIRVAGVFWGTGFLWFTFLFARTLFGPLTAYRAVALTAITPLFAIGIGLLALPETALALPWGVSLWVMALILFDRPTPRRWLLLGLMCGVALQAKVTGILLLGTFPLVLLVSRRHRTLLFSGWLWLSLLVAMTIFLPFVLWNYDHGWPSFAEMGQRITRNTDFHPGRALAVQTGQALFLTPLLWLAAWAAGVGAVKRFIRSRDLKLLFLGLFFLVPQVGFGALALEKKVMPHWPALGFVTAIVALAALAPEWRHAFVGAAGSRRIRFAPVATVTVAMALVASVLLPLGAVFPVIPAAIAEARSLGLVKSGARVIDPMGDVEGDREAGAEAQRLLQGLPAQNATAVLTYHWGVAGRLAFGMEGDHPVYAVGGKANQYGIWKKPEDFLNRDALLVKDDLFRADFRWTFECGKLSVLPPFAAKWRGYTLRSWTFAYCKDLKKIVP
jgi:4-amino-4-deoxy-L-arabinose transferase-like glycosyltransferase